MKWKVLIVDDDMNFRYAMREMIPWSENNFEVVAEAIHGKQALEILQKKEVQIVLTDMDMPVMNGVQLTEEIKKAYPEINVVALSAYDDFGFVKESMRLGASDYILKQDFDGDKIIDTLNKICQESLNKNGEEINRHKHDSELLMYLKGKSNIISTDNGDFNRLKRKKRMLLFFCRSENKPVIENNPDDNLLYIQETEKNMWLIIYKVPQMNRVSEELQFQELMTERIRTGFDNEVWIGCCGGIGDYEKLPRYFAYAEEALEYAVYFPEKQVYQYHEFEKYRKDRERNFIYCPQGLEWCGEIHNMDEQLLKKIPDKEHLNQSIMAVYRKYHNGFTLNKRENDEICFYEEIKNKFFYWEKMNFLRLKIEEEQKEHERLYGVKHPEIKKSIGVYSESLQCGYFSKRNIGLCRLE